VQSAAHWKTSGHVRGAVDDVEPPSFVVAGEPPSGAAEVLEVVLHAARKRTKRAGTAIELEECIPKKITGRAFEYERYLLTFGLRPRIACKVLRGTATWE